MLGHKCSQSALKASRVFVTMPTSAMQMNGGHNWPPNVGILAMEMYFPSYYVDQKELETFDCVSEGKYTIGLGQQKMGFCSDVEDVHSLCLTVVERIMQKQNVKYEEIGHLQVGTETILDKSKSVKTVLMQLFEESGNSDLEGIDTTNACYGGTAALLNAVSWIESSAWDGRFALVVAGDIAIYASGNARPTGGAAAIAMLIGPNAPLVFDRGVRASYMAHVYDFYKPDLSSEYPIVDGRLSVACYTRALDKCYEGYCKKAKAVFEKDISLDDFDAVLFHTPYCKLVQKSLARLLLSDLIRDPNPNLDTKYKGLGAYRGIKLENTYHDRELEQNLVRASSGLYAQKTLPSLKVATNVGNTYTASLYTALASYLDSQSAADLVDRRISLFSYGSGSAATFFSLKIRDASQDRFSLQRLHNSVSNLNTRLESRKKLTPKEFTAILKLREDTHHLAPYRPQGNVKDLFPGTWFLTSIDEMYRRKYDKIPDSSISSNGVSCSGMENVFQKKMSQHPVHKTNGTSA